MKNYNRQDRQDGLEARLQSLLDEYHRTPDAAARRELEEKIVAELYPYFNDFMRDYVAKSLGPGVVDSKHDRSLGFTALLNEAYLKLKRKLNKAESLNWQVDSYKGLRAWFVQVLRNQLWDYHRVKARHPVDSLAAREAQAPATGLRRPAQVSHDAVIGPYYELCRQHVQHSFGVAVEDVLKTLEAWWQSDDPALQRYARVLEERYIAGTPWQELAEVMGVERSKFFAVQKQALERMKEALTA